MKFRKSTLIRWIYFLIFIPLIVMIMGCSRSGSAIIPDDGTYDSMPAISDAGQSGLGSERQLQGIWVADCNPENLTPGSAGVSPANITPIRTADFHLNVRPFISTPHILIKSWNPGTHILDLEVTIRNTSAYNGYDIRLIIFNDIVGHKLLNPDNYTHLWDIPEGSWSNGFKAYAKDNPNRVLLSNQERIENIQILCPGGNFSIQFAIDASWPSNCAEPYMINNFTQGMLQAYAGATSDITVDVYDWQNDVESVRIQASAITGETDTYMTQISSNKWGVELVNNNAVPEGEYFALIAALSEGSSDPLIHLVTVTVSPEVGNGYALTWGGAGDDSGYGIAVDDDGNIFVVGSFSSTVDFNPDPVEEDIHTSVSGFTNAFLSKFDSHGDYIWSQTWGAAGGNTEAYAVATDSLGNIYVGGQSVNYLPGCILMKYDQNGSLLWQGNWGDGNNDYIQSIAIDDFDNIIIGGWYEGSTDFDPDPATTDIKSGFGWSDAFITKFDSSCDYKWSGTWGNTGADNVIGVAVDSQGNAYCSGHFYKTVDLDPGTGTDIHSAVGGTWEDAFLSKFSPEGDFQWGHSWGDYYQDRATDCAVDEFDDVYVVGWFYYTVDFDPDPVDVEQQTAVWYSDGFVSKFDSGGDFQWVFTLGNQSYDYAYNIDTDKENHFIVSGEAFNTDFDPGPGEYIATNRYVAKYQLDEALEWVSNWSEILMKDSCLDLYGNHYLVGYFDDRFDCDPGPDKFNVDSNGSWDVVFIKILPSGLWE